MREKRREGDLSRRKGLEEKFLSREKIDKEEVRDTYKKKREVRDNPGGVEIERDFKEILGEEHNRMRS